MRCPCLVFVVIVAKIIFHEVSLSLMIRSSFSTCSGFVI